MTVQTQRHWVRAWQFQGTLLETYHYAPGKATTSEPHFHSEYQLCLSLDFPGVYHYRGASHPVPKGSLSILHPGEKHSSADPHDREEGTCYCLFYLPPSLFQSVGGEEENRDVVLPFFPDPVLTANDLFSRFLRLHQLLGGAAPLLERESALQTLLSDLTRRHASGVRASPLPRPERGLVRRLQSYLEDNYDHNISLTDLSQLVERHPVYLHQMFRQATGHPPHVYQMQVRIDRAKRLLACGTPLAETARAVGFYDQSHFGKYFRRYVGVTPARYRALRTSYTGPASLRHNPSNAAP